MAYDFGDDANPADTTFQVDQDEDIAYARHPDEGQQPRILLMGLPRSGKSSIQKVVFHKLSPNETLFLDTTSAITHDEVDNNSFLKFQVWDFPGQISPWDEAFDHDTIFSAPGAIVYVIDAQDDLDESLQKLYAAIVNSHKINSALHYEVFIHKVDSLTDEAKLRKTHEIHDRVNTELELLHLSDLQISFYLTSIYDLSIFEALSKVVQKLIPELPTLESCLDVLNAQSNIEKSFLFDVVSKLYIATDTTPVDMKSYEICSDCIDVVTDISGIYGRDAAGNLSAFDQESASIMKLTNSHVLYLRQINEYLALVCLLRQDKYEEHVGTLDYNVVKFRKAIQDVFDVRQAAL
eukprot:m.355880 g.355880  ORF g.355880 m.355880 type:complete len:350 (+) comp17372_c0_seq1:526-1575(+)